MVEHALMVQWVIGSVLHGEPIELFLVPVSAPTKELFFFNDTLNTFYLRLYGIRHMVKDHSDSERGNLLLPHDCCNKGRGMFYSVCGLVHITLFDAR